MWCCCWDICRGRQQEHADLAQAEIALAAIGGNAPPNREALQQIFEYNNLANNPALGVYASGISGAFYTLMRNQESVVNVEGIQIRAPAIKGYKLHVAIDDTIPDNLSAGWNIVKNIVTVQQK